MAIEDRTSLILEAEILVIAANLLEIEEVGRQNESINYRGNWVRGLSCGDRF